MKKITCMRGFVTEGNGRMESRRMRVGRKKMLKIT